MKYYLVSSIKQLCLLSSVLSVIYQEIPKNFKSTKVPGIFVAKRVILAIEPVAMDNFLSVHSAGAGHAGPTVDPDSWQQGSRRFFTESVQVERDEAPVPVLVGDVVYSLGVE